MKVLCGKPGKNARLVATIKRGETTLARKEDAECCRRANPETIDHLTSEPPSLHRARGAPIKAPLPRRQ
jgi:hypothetical protein